ncbi:MAG: T9SS type A sorting domain-containing protein [Gelidibacter sp.]
MKHLYIFCIFFIPLFSFSQNPLSTLDKSDMETDILFATFPVINLNDYQSLTSNTYSFYQAYDAVKNNDLLQRFSDVSRLKADEKESYFTNVIPLAILNVDYDVIKPEAFTNGNIVNGVNNLLYRTTSNPIFDKHELFITSPLRINHKGLNTVFNLPSENIFNTTSIGIETIEVDFDDNQGYRTVTTNQNISIHYPDKGIKELQTRITLVDGTKRHSTSKITIDYSNEDLNTLYQRAVVQFTSTNVPAPNLAPYGEANNYKGIGEYDIYLSPDNILDKPIILVDGFDFGDTRNIQSIYELLNFDDNGTPSNLGDLVRDEGFDVVILNFPIYTRTEDNAVIDGGVDYIERNAMLLVELIQIINGQKQGSEPNVVIGPSMGGLISRYALNYMENQGLNHDTRLWISFDSPHLGANVPIGFQHLFNYMAFGLDLGGFGGDQSIEALQPVVDGMLKSPAARQMLTDQFEPHLANGSNVNFNNNLRLPMAHPFKNIFFNGMNALTPSGFPENLRKVSIINGSGVGNPYPDKNNMPITPDREILNTTVTVIDGITDATFKVRLTPNASATNQVSYLFIDSIFICFCDLTASANSQAFSYSNGIDAGSGGLFDIGALAGAFGTDDPLIDSFLGALQTNYFNFIPSISGMALQVTNNEPNWFHVPTNLTTGRAVNNITPFDAWYMPVENEPHVTLTQGNVAFALEEILQPTLSIPTNEIENYIKIEKNPISNELTFLSNSTYENVSIRMVDITGKIVYDNKISLSERTSIPLNLESGLYVLNLQTENDISFKTKIIVK